MRGNRLTAFVLVLLLGGCGGGSTYREPTPPSVPELNAMLKSEDPDQEITAAVWIQKLGPKATETAPALIAAMKSEHVPVRKNAAMALGQLAPAAADAAVPALAAAVDDDNEERSVQTAAAFSLGQFGPAAASAIPALEKMIARPNQHSVPKNALKKIRP